MTEYQWEKYSVNAFLISTARSSGRIEAELAEAHTLSCLPTPSIHCSLKASPCISHTLCRTQQLRSVKAGSDGVYTTKMAKHAGTKVKTEEKYKATATQTHIYKFV